MKDDKRLLSIKQGLDRREEKMLSSQACFSRHGVRENSEPEIDRGHRQNFSIDTDRILHSLAYSRYIDKTQVFYLVKNDHITHRVLHVQLVSKIARTIGRLLAINEDLIEAIALGHDIGHTPFGHDGEKFLTDLCNSHDIGGFLHNIQSVRFLQKIERKGRGWNLTLQVLDGILCHDGEVHSKGLQPQREKDFKSLYDEMSKKAVDPSANLSPMTLEGCVVRMADTISYIGRDIEDAIRLGLIAREDIPKDCVRILGDTNGTIVYTLVEDLVRNSLNNPHVGFSDEAGEALRKLKEFNYERIYQNVMTHRQTHKIKLMFELLFERYYQDLEAGNEDSDICREFLEGMSPEYRQNKKKAEIVRDFIAGMTDEFFLNKCHKYIIPQIEPGFA